MQAACIWCYVLLCLLPCPLTKDAKTGLQRCVTQDDPEARRKAAMHDPEVQEILRDPAMQMILQQMQSNPAALRE